MMQLSLDMWCADLPSEALSIARFEGELGVFWLVDPDLSQPLSAHEAALIEQHYLTRTTLLLPRTLCIPTSAPNHPEQHVHRIAALQPCAAAAAAAAAASTKAFFEKHKGWRLGWGLGVTKL